MINLGWRELGYHVAMLITIQYLLNDANYISLSLQVVGASVVMAEITGLMAYTNYSVQVAAVNDRGEQGPFSQPVSVFTPEAGMLYEYTSLFCA